HKSETPTAPACAARPRSPCSPSAGASDASPDEGVEADLPMIDERAVEQLTEGLISHYLPDLQRSKSALQELTQQKTELACLKWEGLCISSKSHCKTLFFFSVQKRALKLQQKRQKEELEREQQREKELEREKQLTAKPARRT
uniref:Biogenesis of lysosome-related organelles complex 1 subunit 6 n=1 Tax=Pavo cristatus TaxID=9049 RepID=A0A8C9EMH8_PAVCR